MTLENLTADQIARQLACNHEWQLARRIRLPLSPAPDDHFDAECYHCGLTAQLRYAPQWADNPFSRPQPECRFMGPANGSVLLCGSGLHLARFTVA